MKLFPCATAPRSPTVITEIEMSQQCCWRFKYPVDAVPLAVSSRYLEGMHCLHPCSTPYLSTQFFFLDCRPWKWMHYIPETWGNTCLVTLCNIHNRLQSSTVTLLWQKNISSFSLHSSLLPVTHEKRLHLTNKDKYNYCDLHMCIHIYTHTHTDNALAYIAPCQRQRSYLSPFLLLRIVLFNSGKLGRAIAATDGINFPFNYSNVKTTTGFLHRGQGVPQISFWVIQLHTLQTLGPVVTACNIKESSINASDTIHAVSTQYLI